MKITVLYFASLADRAQKSQETIVVANDTSIAQLYEQLQAQYRFNLEADKLRVAINDEFGEWEDGLNDGDTLAFIPPVAGG